MFTRTDDACVEYREVLLAGGEGGYGEGATGLSATAHPPLRWRAGTLSSCTHKGKKSFIVVMVLFHSNLSYTFLAHVMMGRHHFFNMIPPSHSTRGRDKTHYSCHERVKL